MLTILVQWDPESSSAICVSASPTDDPRPFFTTCTSPEQLWASIQHLSRPQALFDMDKARKALALARQRKIEEDISLSEAVATLCSASPSDYELITSPNLLKTLRKRQPPATINYEDLFE